MQVKNWAKFQHFKDRRPPWVKLYRDILDDIEWHKLDGDSAKMLINVWLIASEYSGQLPDIATLAFRLRITENQVKKSLSMLGHWLISERYQDDIEVIQKISATDIEVPLREREETEREKETEVKKVSPPNGVSITVWQDFQKLRRTLKAPITETAMAGIQREADKAGYSLEKALTTCVERSWRGFKSEWITDKPEVSNVMRGVL